MSALERLSGIEIPFFFQTEGAYAVEVRLGQHSELETINARGNEFLLEP